MLDKKAEELSNALSRKIWYCYERAKEAKNEVHLTLQECFRMSRGQALVPANDEVDVVMDVASPVVQNIIGLLRQILLNNEQAPFVIKPTPRADLSPTEQAEIEQTLMNHSADFVARGLSQEDVTALADALKRTALLETNKKARMAADKLTDLVQDQLHDAGWKREFVGFLKHFCIYPAAIMKGPALKRRMQTFWEGDRVQLRATDAVSVELISPFNFFPAPFARDVDSADYIIERRRLTRGDMADLLDNADYDADAVGTVLDNYPSGYTLPFDTAGADEDHPDTDTTDASMRDVFDALGYYGAVRGDVLADAGLDVADERLTYEVEVWEIGGVVIKAVLNPDPAGSRPFCVASFDATTDSIWGISPMMRLRDTQLTATATIRNLIRNMAYSSAPMGEAIVKRIKDGLPPNELVPGSIRLVEDAMLTGQSSTAYNFYQIPSLAPELTALFEKFVNYSYELLGIPRVAFGQTDNLGSIGRTSGGVSIVMNQASKAIKNAMTELESGLIEPMVNKFILFNQINSDNPEIRGDVRAYAKGVSGLIEKEGKIEDLQWGLQSIAALAGTTDPATGQSVIPPLAPARLLYEIFKLKGISTTGIFPDFDAQEAMQEDLGDLAPGAAPTANMPLNDPASLPTLDGRSPDAAAAIETSNQVV